VSGAKDPVPNNDGGWGKTAGTTMGRGQVSMLLCLGRAAGGFRPYGLFVGLTLVLGLSGHDPALAAPEAAKAVAAKPPEVQLGAWLSASLGPRAFVPRVPGGAELLDLHGAAGLERAFEARGFRLADVRGGRRAVPRLYVTHMPRDLSGLRDVKARKALFLRALLPIVLMANEEIHVLRRRTAALVRREAGGDPLWGAERVWLAALSERYGVSDGDRVELLRRLDGAPVSLALAQSIQESGWGSSRFARKGNALFGQRTWKNAIPGLVPERREEGKAHRVRAFADLMAAARSYMHNLNTHPAYEDFRRLRTRLRASGEHAQGKRLAATLLRYAEEGPGYVKALHIIMRTNALHAFDRARLSSGILARAGLSS
jgi:Bax protein